MNTIKGKITNIKITEDKCDYVYDLTVEDNHNFFVEGVLVSNCHHLAANTFVDISKKAKNAYYRIGVSATPWRDDGADMMIESALTKRCDKYDITASKLIEQGYLVPCDIYMVPCHTVFKGKNYDKLYKEAIVNNAKRNIIGCKIALKMYDNNKATTLILIKQLDHGRKIFKTLGTVLEKRGVLKRLETKQIKDNKGEVVDDIPVYFGKRIEVEDPNTKEKVLVKVCELEMLTGSDSALRRTAVIEGVKQGIVKILIGSTIADEGLDIPNLDCLILLGAGKSSTRAFQRVGRVLRIAKNKKKAIVFDFVDDTPIFKQQAIKRMSMYKKEPLWNIKKFDINKLK